MNSSFVEIQKFPIAGDGFIISRETKLDAIVVFVRLQRNGFSGAGECVPLKRYGHTPEKIEEEIETWLQAEKIWTRDHLLHSLPPGPARFALDTALWQLEAAEQGKSLQEYFGAKITPLETAFTISIGAADKMATTAKERKNFRWLKIKLMGDGLDEERLAAIHAMAPQTELIVDANEALNIGTLQSLLPVFRRNNVVLIEQPMPAGKDEELRDFHSPIPLAADESCHSIDDLEELRGKYDVVNIKLDKCGGLTHGIAMKQRAEELGFKIMLGCMASTSLSILPAFFLAQGAAFVDLDGALLLQQDRKDALLDYNDGVISLKE